MPFELGLDIRGLFLGQQLGDPIPVREVGQIVLVEDDLGAIGTERRRPEPVPRKYSVNGWYTSRGQVSGFLKHLKFQGL